MRLLLTCSRCSGNDYEDIKEREVTCTTCGLTQGIPEGVPLSSNDTPKGIAAARRLYWAAITEIKRRYGLTMVSHPGYEETEEDGKVIASGRVYFTVQGDSLLSVKIKATDKKAQVSDPILAEGAFNIKVKG